MRLFRAKSREEKILDYLVGAGLLSKLPNNDTAFYCLAGSCCSVLWPTKPRTSTKPTSVIDEQELNLRDGEKCSSSEIVEHSANQDQRDTTNNHVPNDIFKPKPSLPAPLFQETFRKWKSSMDMQLRFRRLRRLRADVVFQPLDEFPSFLASFHIQLRDYGYLGFFELLHEFMKVYFAGANIHLNSTTSTSAWSVTSRVHKATGERQVLIHSFSTDYFGFK